MRAGVHAGAVQHCSQHPGRREEVATTFPAVLRSDLPLSRAARSGTSAGRLAPLPRDLAKQRITCRLTDLKPRRRVHGDRLRVFDVNAELGLAWVCVSNPQTGT
eukprot:SAG31_NODE_157_length_22047_cov_5.897849_5_plen_104_part_00